MKNNKMKNIITIVLLIMLVVVGGLLMWRNGFPTKKHTRIKIPPQLRSGQIIEKVKDENYGYYARHQPEQDELNKH